MERTIAMLMPGYANPDALRAVLPRLAPRPATALALFDATFDGLDDPALSESAADLREAALAAGLRLAALTSDTPLISDAPTAADRREPVAHAAAPAVLRLLSLAQALRARTLSLPLHTDAPAFGRPHDRARAALDALRAARFDAERHGCRLAVRMHAPPDWLSPLAARDLFDLANSCWVGLEVSTRWPGVVDWIDTLTHRVAAIRLDAPVPIAPLGEALSRARCHGPILVPPNVPIDPLAPLLAAERP